MAKKQRKTDRARHNPERAQGHVVAELSDYFRYEDIGPPAVDPQPRAGTTSTLPHPPKWGPGSDPVLMSAVYKRLVYAQRWMKANIFAVLRARYGIIDPRDKVVGDQVKDPAYANLIDHAEILYARARPVAFVEPPENRRRIALECQLDRLLGSDK
jgi:hypothetical protein